MGTLSKSGYCLPGWRKSLKCLEIELFQRCRERNLSLYIDIIDTFSHFLSIQSTKIHQLVHSFNWYSQSRLNRPIR